MTTSAEERDLVVAEARTWLGTPYGHNAAIKGGGVDCGRLIIETFVKVGLAAPVETGYYTHDWHLHRDEEKYLSFVETYMTRIDKEETSFQEREGFLPLPGDLLVWRVGRTFSHGALVTKWPNIIHSYYPSRMVEEVELPNSPMAFRLMRQYSFWSDDR